MKKLIRKTISLKYQHLLHRELQRDISSLADLAPELEHRLQRRHLFLLLRVDQLLVVLREHREMDRLCLAQRVDRDVRG